MIMPFGKYLSIWTFFQAWPWLYFISESGTVMFDGKIIWKKCSTWTTFALNTWMQTVMNRFMSFPVSKHIYIYIYMVGWVNNLLKSAQYGCRAIYYWSNLSTHFGYQWFHAICNHQASLMIANSMKPPVAKMCWQVTPIIYIYTYINVSAYGYNPYRYL